MMSVLAHQSTLDTLNNCYVILANCRDVREQPSIGVDPSPICHVQLVFCSANGVV